VQSDFQLLNESGNSLESRPAVSWPERAASLVNHALVLGLLVSMTITVIQFAERVWPEWDGSYMVLLAVGVALEAMASTKVLMRVNWFDADWFFLRGAEWVVILVSLRGLVYYLQGFGSLREDIERWGFEIFNYFNNMEYFALMIFAIIIWSLANAFTRDLAGQEGDRLIVDRYSFRFALQDRETSRRRLVNRVFSLGMLLVVLSALVRADLGIIWGERPQLSGGGANILLYFLLGLVLFSLSQYATLRAFWTWDRIPVDRHLSWNWARYSFTFLAGVIAVVSFLPTWFSLGFLAYMQSVMYSLLNLISRLVTAIWSLVLLLIYLLASMFGTTDRPYTPSEPLLPDIVPPAPPPSSTLDPAFAFLDALRMGFFWLIFLGVVYFSFDYFLRHYRDRLISVRRISWVQAIGRVWEWFLAAFRRWNKDMVRAVGEGVDRLSEIIAQRPQMEGFWLNAFNPLRLSSRQQVIFYYLAMVRKGGLHGALRRPGETPMEYAQDLRIFLPEAAAEVSELTAIFSTARYSDQVIGREHAQKARSVWKVVQKAFRSKAN
jgi:hypothetical protein